MGFTYQYGDYNAAATLNDHLRINLTGAGVPGWMPSANLVYDWPERPLFSGYSGHAFTVTHFDPEPIEQYQGRGVASTGAAEKGQLMQGAFEVNCWVSKREAGASTPARLRQMGDMVRRVYVSAYDIALKDWYQSTVTPPNLSALIRVSPAAGLAVNNPDPANPDVHRKRFRVTYIYVERISA